MSNPQLPFKCTSAELEKAAIKRFRTLIGLSSSQCRVFREPWDCSTVLCLDFAQCPDLLDSVQAKEHLLIQAMQSLGFGNAIVFRLGTKLLGWKSISPLS